MESATYSFRASLPNFEPQAAKTWSFTDNYKSVGPVKNTGADVVSHAQGRGARVNYVCYSGSQAPPLSGWRSKGQSGNPDGRWHFPVPTQSGSRKWLSYEVDGTGPAPSLSMVIAAQARIAAPRCNRVTQCVFPHHRWPSTSPRQART